jgi:superfamily II DNA or RNA helicase
MASDDVVTSLPHPLQWYPHQIDAINQCIDVERRNMPVCALDMPMGFGKTLVLLTLAMVMQPGLTLWLCEKTHMSTVVADVRKFFPNAYIGTVAAVNDVALPPCHGRGVVVMSYTSFERVVVAHPKGAWMMLRRILDLLPIVRVVCDEAQRIPAVGRRRELIDALQSQRGTSAPGHRSVMAAHRHVRSGPTSAPWLCRVSSSNTYAPNSRRPSSGNTIASFWIFMRPPRASKT